MLGVMQCILPVEVPCDGVSNDSPKHPVGDQGESVATTAGHQSSGIRSEERERANKIVTDWD